MRISAAVLAAAALAAILAGCGDTTTAHPSASASTPANATATPSASAGALTEAELVTIYTSLNPSATGHNCVTGTSTPSWTACPLTPRLVAALNAALAAQTGPGSDPLCGCQAVDPQQAATYVVGTPPGGGTIHVTSFGSAHLAYVVIASGGAFLVDDIIYCTPTAHSIYPGETATSC